MPAGLRAIEPGDFEYADVRSTYMRGGAPGIVLQPDSPAQVAEAVAFARRHPDAALAVRSGGHGISGRSTNDGGIVIDLRRLNAIEVIDEERRLVRIGPGARWMEVAAALGEHGWALTSGDYGGVGVGGLATAGGIGFLAREHGLTIDHLRAAEVVLADGSIVRTDADDPARPVLGGPRRGRQHRHRDGFEFEVDEVGEVGWAQLAFEVGRRRSSSSGYGRIVEAAPRDLTAFLIMGGTRPGQPRIAQIMAMVDSDDPDTIIERLQPFAELAPLVQQSVHAHDLPARDGERRPRAAARHRRAALAVRARRARHARRSLAAAIAMLDAGELLLPPVPLGRRRRRGRAPRARRRTPTARRTSRSSRWARTPTVSTRRGEAVAAHGQGMYLSFDSSLRPGADRRGVPGSRRSSGCARSRPRSTLTACSATTSR